MMVAIAVSSPIAKTMTIHLFMAADAAERGCAARSRSPATITGSIQWWFAQGAVHTAPRTTLQLSCIRIVGVRMETAPYQGIGRRFPFANEHMALEHLDAGGATQYRCKYRWML